MDRTRNRSRMGDQVAGSLDLVGRAGSGARITGWWGVKHLRPRQFIKGIIRPPLVLYEGRNHNLIVNTGLDELLDVGLSHAATQANWYIGLKDTGTPVAADTMASHASWATITPYSNASDPGWVDAGVSGQSADNSASTADFTINATDTVYGTFLKDNNTKGGATGLLFAVSDFAASRDVIDGDTLKVTATYTQADDGV